MKDFVPTIGRWWASNSPDRPVSGYLSVGHEGIGDWHLRIDGELGSDTGPGIDRHIAIHGATPQGKYTLLRAHTGTIWRGETTSQEWRGWQLFHGGHITHEQRFSSIAFRLPWLWNWLGPAKLSYHRPNERFRAKPDDEPVFLVAQLSGDQNLRLGPTFVESFGDTGESWTGHGIYYLDAPGGITLPDYERVAFALTGLHAILTATPMSTYETQLVIGRDPFTPRLTLVDPHPAVGLDWTGGGLRDLFMDTAEVNFKEFIVNWLSLSEGAVTAVAIAAPRDSGQYVDTNVVEACNALEALASHLWSRPTLNAQDEDVLRKLLDAGVTSETRRYIRSQLLARRWRLEDKLVGLAGMLGAESAAWLLGPSLEDWAHLVARLRNSLTHGFRLPGGLSDDVGFIITAQRSATAVLRLALLRSAGYGNPLSPTRGELLYASERPTVGHPNSDLFREFKDIASYAAEWSGWRSRLDQA